MPGAAITDVTASARIALCEKSIADRKGVTMLEKVWGGWIVLVKGVTFSEVEFRVGPDPTGRGGDGLAAAGGNRPYFQALQSFKVSKLSHSIVVKFGFL